MLLWIQDFKSFIRNQKSFARILLLLLILLLLFANAIMFTTGSFDSFLNFKEGFEYGCDDVSVNKIINTINYY